MAIIKEKQDMTHLKWSDIHSCGRLGGAFPKCFEEKNGEKVYYKLSEYNPSKGIYGHENINEVIVDRLLTLFGVNHLEYDLIYADVEIAGKKCSTYVCASKDFKAPCESKVALCDYYFANHMPMESHYDFCVRQGFRSEIDKMLAIDYIVMNRDRHGNNIEVIRNSKEHTVRLAPFFDQGVSFLSACYSDGEASNFDVMTDMKCNNYIGSRRSAFENLKLIDKNNKPLKRKFGESDREFLFDGLDGILSPCYMDKIWEMIVRRYEVYENL